MVQLYNNMNSIQQSFINDLNPNLAYLVKTYEIYLSNPGPNSPQKLVDYVREALNALYHEPVESNSNALNQAKVYARGTIELLREIFNSYFLTTPTTSGDSKADLKNQLLDSNTNSEMESFFNELTNYDSSQIDIIEDQQHAMMHNDYDISRYVESLEENKNLTSSNHSLTKHYELKGKKLPPKCQAPYRGLNKRQIVEDPYQPEPYTKDLNYPKPGIITGKIRDIDMYNLHPNNTFRYTSVSDKCCRS